MKRSDDRILTTHVGSLPRPSDLIELYRDRCAGRDAAAAPEIRDRRGRAAAAPTSASTSSTTANSARRCARRRLRRVVVLRLRPPGRLRGARRAGPEGRAAWTFGSKERKEFAEFYAAEAAPVRRAPWRSDSGTSTARLSAWSAPAPVKYTGHAPSQRDIDNLKAALGSARVEEALHDRRVAGDAADPAERALQDSARTTPGRWRRRSARNTRPSSTPASSCRSTTRRWSTSTTGGSRSTTTWPAIRKWAAFQVEAVNHALEGIPEDRVRFHICWGSWHGPHSTDVPLKDVVDLLLKVKAQAYSIEAGNVRHEHEWKVWRDASSCRRARC